MIVPCPYCGQDGVRTTGQELYPHRRDLYALQFFICRPCDAYVGCHPNGSPKGSLANSEVRSWRMRAHAAFDPFWKSGRVKRTVAYQWLARELEIPFARCHIGEFDVAQCIMVIVKCKEKERVLDAKGL